MPALQTTAPITAIVYGDGARIAPLIDAITSELGSAGFRLAGLIQRDRVRAGRSRCDMLMEDLTTGDMIAVSQDRGEGARGCRLDVDALLGAVGRVQQAMATKPDLLVVNKFGKTECEGGGCRSLIAEAVEREIPVLVAVPYANLDVWRRFADDIAAEYSLDDLLLNGTHECGHLGLVESPHVGEAGPAIIAPR